MGRRGAGSLACLEEWVPGDDVSIWGSSLAIYSIVDLALFSMKCLQPTFSSQKTL